MSQYEDYCWEQSQYYRRVKADIRTSTVTNTDAIGNDNTVLAGRPHRIDILCRQSIGQHTNRCAVGPKEHAVRASRGTRASVASGHYPLTAKSIPTRWPISRM